MSVSFSKLSIALAVSTMLASCSFMGESPSAEQWNIQKASELAASGKALLPSECLPELGAPFSYRKNLLVVGSVSVPELARDLPGLARLTSARLQNRLDELTRLNVVANHESSFESMAADTPDLVKQFAREYKSQFVVKLDVLDLTVHSRGTWVYRLMGGQPKRNVTIKAYVYDGTYGELIFSEQYQDTVSGDVEGFSGDSNTVTTVYWSTTLLGRKIADIIEDISVEVNDKLACVPLSANIISVQGRDIYIDAGFLNGLKAGESLRVYRQSAIWEPDGSLKAGINDGWITIKTVYPSRSIAQIRDDETTSAVRVDVGDEVRAW